MEEKLEQILKKLETFESDIKKDINILKSDVTTLKDDVTALKSDAAKSDIALKDDIEALKNDMNVLKSDVTTLKNDVTALKSDINKNDIVLKDDIGTLKNYIKTLNTDVGNLFEMTARHEIAKNYGQRYSERFELFDLNGIVRLLAPKLQLLPEETSLNKDSNVQSQAWIMDNRAKKLAEDIKCNNLIKKLETRIREAKMHPNLKKKNDSYQDNLKALYERANDTLSYFTENKGDNDTEKVNSLLIHTRTLSIMILTSHLLELNEAINHDQPPFYELLDIDVRGRVDFHITSKQSPVINIEIGEIKKSSGRKAIRNACRQLWLRLAVLGHAFRVLYPNNISCNLTGKLFVPKVEQATKVRWKGGVTFAENCNYDIVLVPI